MQRVFHPCPAQITVDFRQAYHPNRNHVLADLWDRAQPGCLYIEGVLGTGFLHPDSIAAAELQDVGGAPVHYLKQPRIPAGDGPFMQADFGMNYSIMIGMEKGENESYVFLLPAEQIQAEPLETDDPHNDPVWEHAPPPVMTFQRSTADEKIYKVSHTNFQRCVQVIAPIAAQKVRGEAEGKDEDDR